MNLIMHEQVPPGRPPHTLEYSTDGDILTVTHTAGEVVTTDTFDFTGTPDGELDMESIETSLPVQPILSAERVGGELNVEVLDWGVEE